MEMLIFQAVFKAIVFVGVKCGVHSERPHHADAGQHEITGSTVAEVQIAGFVEEYVGTAGQVMTSVIPLFASRHCYRADQSPLPER